MAREAASALNEEQAQAVLHHLRARLRHGDPASGRAFLALGELPAFQSNLVAEMIREDMFQSLEDADWICADLLGLALKADDSAVREALEAWPEALPQCLARHEAFVLRAQIASAASGEAASAGLAPDAQDPSAPARRAARL